MSKPVIAIDMGGTKIKIGIVQHDTILNSVSIDAHSAHGLRPQLPHIKKMWINYLKIWESRSIVYPEWEFLHQELWITIKKGYSLWIKNSMMLRILIWRNGAY